MQPGQPVTIERGDGWHHLTWSVGHSATVVQMIGVFVLVDVEDIGPRCVLPEYLQPKVTFETFRNND